MKRVDPSIAAVLLLLSTALGRASGQEQAAVGGVVRDLHGIPQLGALVELLGPGSSVLAHTYTDDRGRYLLPAPQPGHYGLRTSAAFFLPSLRRNLRVNAGDHTLANVTMSAVFDVGTWFPMEKRSRTEPADDWRWTLRSSAERPLLRLAESPESDSENFRGDATGEEQSSSPDDSIPYLASTEGSAPVLQHEQLRLLAGSSGLLEDGLRQRLRLEREDAREGILSVQAMVGVGSHSTGTDEAPAIAVSTGYQQRNSFTHSQYRVEAGYVTLPELAGAGASGYQSATLATGERILLGDMVTIDAGTLFSAERLVSSRISSAPFLRMVVHPSSNVAVMYRYAGSREVQSLDDFGAVQSTATPLTDASGQPVGQPGTHQELAVSHSTQQDTETLALYHDRFAIGSIEGGGRSESGSFAGMPVLSNGGNGNFVLAVAGYSSEGVSASWTHEISADIQASLEADFGTTLTVQASRVSDLRSLQETVVACKRPSLTAAVAGKVPNTGTSFEVRYHWQPNESLTIINPFNSATDEAYAGVLVKQRLWRGRQLRGVSAVLEASNLLEEGYQPVIGPDGETLFLAQVPRTMQAGLTFSF